jgi:ribonucleoside-triphosphate reductase
MNGHNVSPTERFSGYLHKRAGDASSDKNANAAVKSLSSYIMQVAHDELEQLTIDLVSEKMDSSDAFEFWEDEYHVNKENPIFYFHDITRGIVPYCYAASASDIFYRGRFYADEYRSDPPKRFSTFMGQMAEFAMEMSQDHAGAIALPDIFVYGAKYFNSIEEIEMNLDGIKNAIQSFIFIVHNKFRIQGQSPFTNITILDEPTMTEVFGITDPDERARIKRIQEIYMWVHSAGCNGVPFRFPVTTMNFLSKDGKVVDESSLEDRLDDIASGKYNIYVSNDPRKFASCCRMINDVGVMYGIDSFGNGGVNVGSTRVVTLVLPNIAMRSYCGDEFSEESFIKNLKGYTELSCTALMAHREVLKDCVEAGLLKFFTAGIESLKKNYFSTVGFVGLWEAAKLLAGKSDDVYDVGEKEELILRTIKKVIEAYGKRHGVPFNSEEIPGESAAIDLAKATGAKWLSNQYVPLDLEYDLFDRINIAGKLDSLCTGGAITFLNVNGKMSREHARVIVELAVKHGMTHFAINPCITMCDDCDHKEWSKKAKCISCGSDNVDYMTRIIGYFVPVSRWRKERADEFTTRKWTSVHKEIPETS